MSEMTLGACLVANEPDGLTKALIDARVDGKSWKQIADEFGYANPSAARSAFKKATGIGDFKIKGPAVKDLFNKLHGTNSLADDAIKAIIADPPSAKQLKFIDDLIKKKDIPDGLKYDIDKLTKKEASKLIDDLKALPEKGGTKATKLKNLEQAYDNAQGIGASPGLQQQWQNLPDSDLDDLIKFYNEKAAKKVSQTTVGQSPTGTSASKKLASDWDPKVKPKPGYTLDGDIVSDLKNGQTYANLSKKYGKTIGEIDEINWQRLLNENDGDVWASFLKKPTSQSAETAVKKMYQDAMQAGVSPEDFIKKTGIDKETFNALQKGTWTKSPPGSYSYTPPASSGSYPSPPGSTPSYSTPSYSSTPTQVGNTTPNFPKGDHQDMISWMSNFGNDLSYSELESLKRYTGSGYMEINSYLRGRISDTTPLTKGYIDEIDKVFRPIHKDVHVVRGTSKDSLGGKNPMEMVGTVYEDKGFMSTSVGSGFSGDIKFIIDIPAGTPARYVDNISLHSGERELVLPRGTKFMVEGVRVVKGQWNEVTEIYMRVVGHGVTG